MRPDVVVDFQGLLRSALIGRISGARKIFGLSDAREGSRFFYDQVAQVDRGGHAVDRYLKLAETMGAKASSPLPFPLPSGDPLPRFDEYSPFILLHPFARGRGKSLSDAVVAEICRLFSPARVVVVGRSKLRVTAPENCVDLSGQTTLLQLIRLIRTAGFVITRGQRADAHRGRGHRPSRLDPHLDRSASCRPLQFQRLDLERWRPSTRCVILLRPGKSKPEDVSVSATRPK